MKNVIVLIGAGQIGQVIARRVGVGKHVLLADMRSENAGYEVSVATVDASSREEVHRLVNKAMELGDVTGLIHAAGVSPPRPRHHRRRSSKSIFMVRRSCWKSSAMSSHGVALVSSSPLSRGIVLPRSPSNKTKH